MPFILHIFFDSPSWKELITLKFPHSLFFILFSQHFTSYSVLVFIKYNVVSLSFPGLLKQFFLFLIPPVSSFICQLSLPEGGR